MKSILFSVIFFGCLGLSQGKAQQKNESEELKAVVFGLLHQKHAYEEVMSRKKSKSPEEYKSIRESELNKSEYGKSVKAMKSNAPEYLAYIEKAIKNEAESLSKQEICYCYVPKTSSGPPDMFNISKLDYLKALKYSLFEKKSDELLELYLIPELKLKYGKPKSAAIRPIEQQ